MREKSVSIFILGEERIGRKLTSLDSFPSYSS